MKKKCELLIPAGGVNQFIAAVENGADAVYLGGKVFNARINAGNFENEDLKKVVDFAHLRGVKVYVTMNTLILDEEMSKALQYAGFLYKIGVDALIIQDIGFAYEVRKIFPDFPMHLSTQGSVYNLEGVLAAKKMGFERVVLARELSFDEIDEIAKNDDTELEVFVHGALCLCYSGQCQMSRYFGGRSGNRGQCAQPCRLPYKVLDEDFRLVDSFKYPLSPKDLCLIDQIGDLAKIGVASLKVEGRMKSAEYVAVVTRIYRKYLDEYYEKGWYQVSDEDRHELMQIFNRGGFTQGYYWGDPEQQLISGDIPKHRGVKLGKVIKQVQGTSLIDVKLYRKLSIGDGVEIQGREVFGNIVTYIKPLKGGLTRIGDLKGRTVHGDILYQISSKEQLKEAKETYSNVTLSEGKYMRKTPVNMEFHGQFGKHLTLKITCCIEKRNFAVVIEDEPDLIQKAFNKATSEEDIRKQLGKMGNTPFMLGKVGICVDNDIM
ncbi:MAG: U32 family peptidase, partial [Eubacteriales bacterium]|nr:U32 family peptidase [Eubacteriales bacterium]